MKEMKLEFTNLKIQYKKLENEIIAALKEVMESSAFINGPQVKKFEEELANYCGTKFAIGVSSGTDALLLSLMAIDVQPGDEVITTPFTFIATAEVIALLKAKPVFVDIDEKTYNIDVSKIEEKITNKTKAIIPVHLYGQMADMDEIMNLAKKYNLYVIEDSAQAIGALYKGKKAGSIGDLGSFSFFPAKNLGCYGDGGAVVTNNKELADKIYKLRQHGSEKRYEHLLIGTNARLDTMQAAILLVKIKYLDNWIENRIKLANNYTKNLKDLVITPYVKNNLKHVFNQYTIRTKDRDELIKFLNENGIPTAVHYPKPLHLQTAFKYLNYIEGDFPISETISKEVLSLPMYPEMSENEQKLVIDTIRNFYEKK